MTDDSSPPNPYAAPKAASLDPEGARLAPLGEGRSLCFGTAARLPKICVGCGTRKRVRYADQEFLYVPPIFYVALPFIGVLAFFFGAMVRRKARIAIPRCPRCTETASRSQALIGPLSIGMIVFLFAGATFAGNGLPLVGAAVAGGVAAFTISYLLWVRVLYATHIANEVVTLRGIHEKALAQIAATTSSNVAEATEDEE